MHRSNRVTAPFSHSLPTTHELPFRYIALWSMERPYVVSIRESGLDHLQPRGVYKIS